MTERFSLMPGGGTPRRVVFINGPPGCGKDLAGKLIEEFNANPIYLTKFAKALKERTHALYCLTNGTRPLPHDHFELLKDQPLPEFGGISPRQAYIEVSEKLMKPLHGQDYWGKILLEDLNGGDGAWSDLTVVTDSGFDYEAAPVIEAFGEANCSLIRLHRKGHNFDNDSRSYINLKNVPTYDLDNNGTPLQLAYNLGIVIGFELSYRIEVQLPTGDNALNWFQQGQPRSTYDHALAVVEALRQGDYGSRVIRIVVGKDHVLKMVMPGDKPVMELV